MANHEQWMAPAPLWTEAVRTAEGSAIGALRRPSILRFATDTFMEDYQRILDSDPNRLADLLLSGETWQGPLPAVTPPERVPALLRDVQRRRRLSTSGQSQSQSPAAHAAATEVPKLYQPAHQRFYLVSACLVCRLPGLPDRTIDAGNQERATFVVRRLIPSGSSMDEYAFVSTGTSVGWQKLAEGQVTPAPGEEQLPLASVNFVDDTGRRRRLLTGLIPVGKRQAYLGAPRLAAPTDPPPDPQDPDKPPDPRLFLLQSTVTAPWINLLERATAVSAALHPSDPGTRPPPAGEDARMKRKAREQAQTISWYVILDFAHFLKLHMPNIWAALTDASPAPNLSTAEQDVVNRLRAAKPGSALINDLIAIEKDPPAATTSAYQASDIWPSLAAALASIANPQTESLLEGVIAEYNRKTRGAGWPTSILPLADPVHPAAVPLATEQAIHDLEDAIVKALPEKPIRSTPPTPLALQPVMDPAGGAQFAIRCVFDRPDCAPLVPPLVSDRSVLFRLAGFFDPEAPARPIRIELPGDITPAGLRKFDKNTAFMISDALCGQLTRIRGHLSLGDLVLSVLPWPFHKDLPTESGGAGAPCTDNDGNAIGMICTLSLPIITLCALILLFVIVLLFDVIFHWLPYFFICFPLPRFNAKRST